MVTKQTVNRFVAQPVIGVLIIRRDKQTNLSFNDMRAIALFSAQNPALERVPVLVINMPRERNQSWVFSSHHTLLLTSPSFGYVSHHLLYTYPV